MSRKRRGRGEGSISQRADGTWEAKISLGYDGEGKRHRRTVYGKTKGEVQEKLRKIQTDTLVGHLAEHGSARCRRQVLPDEGPNPEPEAFHLFDLGVVDLLGRGHDALFFSR